MDRLPIHLPEYVCLNMSAFQYTCLNMSGTALQADVEASGQQCGCLADRLPERRQQGEPPGI